MSRYAKYFLHHLLCVEDTFSRYYVQDDSWGSRDILDVEYIIFDWEEEAEDWLNQCKEFDRSTTMDSLRYMLAYECLATYQVHRMNDRSVMRTVASELCTNACRVVIEPKIGGAVRLDQAIEAPVQPVSVDAASDVSGQLDQLQVALDELVDEQKKNYIEWEAKLAKMSDAEKALAYGKSTGEGAYNGTIGGIIDMEKSWLSFMWKAIKYPLRFSEIEREALRTGSWDPIKKEIKSKVDPVVCSAKEIKHYTGMAMVLLGEPETRGMLADFAKRFWDNTHPIEKTKLVADLGSDAILTVLLAIFTAGLGAAANIAAKSNRLVKVARLLEKVAKSLKRVKSFTRLPKKQKGAGLGKKKARAKDTLKGKGPQNPKSPKKGLDVDGNKKKSYKDSDGPKTTHSEPKPEAKPSAKPEPKPKWTSKEVNGRRVYQRDDLFDPNAVDANGMTNLERMRKGRPPIGHDGEAVNLHHLTQNEPGSLAEVGGKFHSENSKTLHGLTETKRSFRYSPDGKTTDAEKAFRRYSYNYWQDRAKGF